MNFKMAVTLGVVYIYTLYLLKNKYSINFYALLKLFARDG